MEMTPAETRTLELSRASAADTPSVHRLSKDELVETTTTWRPPSVRIDREKKTCGFALQHGSGSLLVNDELIWLTRTFLRAQNKGKDLF
jgi:hypothetical protein